MIENEMKLTIPSHSSNESFARIAVAGFFCPVGPLPLMKSRILKQRFQKQLPMPLYMDTETRLA